MEHNGTLFQLRHGVIGTMEHRCPQHAPLDSMQPPVASDHCGSRSLFSDSCIRIVESECPRELLKGAMYSIYKCMPYTQAHTRIYIYIYIYIYKN